MNWDTLFGWYTLLCIMLGWPVEKALKRVWGSARTWGLGAVLLVANLLVFLWCGDLYNLFAWSSHPTEPGLRFVLYPTAILGLLSCFDCIRYYISRFFHKDAA